MTRGKPLAARDGDAPVVRRDDFTRFKYDVLAVIAGFETGLYNQTSYPGDRPHGTAIKDTLERRYREEVNHGRLYPNLDELRDQGLIEKGEVDDRTNYYGLTDTGWDILDQRRTWFNTVVSPGLPGGRES